MVKKKKLISTDRMKQIAKDRQLLFAQIALHFLVTVASTGITFPADQSPVIFEDNISLQVVKECAKDGQSMPYIDREKLEVRDMKHFR